MQFDDLDLSSDPPKEDWLQSTNSRDDVTITVPLSIEENGVPWILGAGVLSDNAVTMLYYHVMADSWKLFTEYTLKNDFNIYNDDLLSPEIGFQDKDARAMRELAHQFGQKINETNRIGFAPYIDTGAQDQFKEARQNCNCSSISEPQVQIVPGLSGIEDERIYMCGECMTPHGFEYRDSPIRAEKAFDADWVLENEAPDDFVEIGDSNSYLLYSSGQSTGKVEHTIGLMNVIGGGISNSFSLYKPDKQKALVYVHDDIIVGYLTWTLEGDGYPSLQQLFTRSNYRRNGIAATLIDTWIDIFCESDVFYVEDPNEKSRELIKDLGYWSNDGDPAAVEHYLFLGVSNNLDEGMERAESVARTRQRIS